MSIRALLFWLVLACLAPLACMLAYAIHSHAQTEIARAKEQMRTLAKVIGANTGDTLSDARRALQTMAQRPLVRALDRRRCDPLLGTYRTLVANLVDVETVDTGGTVVCSAAANPALPPVSVAATDWFQRAMRERRFLIGRPYTESAGAKPVSMIVQPLRGADGALTGFVGLALDLGSYDPNLSGAPLPPGMHYGILRADGVLVWRNEDPNHAIGNPTRHSKLAKKLLEVGDGSIEGKSAADGIDRYYAVTPIPQTDLYAYIGVPSRVIYDEAMRSAGRNALVGLLVVVGVAVALLGVARRITRPVRSLAAAARALQAGQADARADLGGTRETAEVANAFNRLIDEWQAAQAKLRASAAEIEDLYQNAPCGYHSIDVTGTLVRMNDTELSWIGYRRDEVIGKLKLEDILSPRGRDTFHREFPRFLEGGDIRDLEQEYVRKDGTILPVLIGATAVFDAEGRFVKSRTMVYDLTERKKMEQERAEHARRIEELSRHLMDVQEQERRELSGELHDRTGANLAALSTHLRVIGDKLPAPVSEDMAALLDDARAVLEDTTRSVRDICANLRPPMLDYSGLLPALQGYAFQFTRRTGIVARVDGTGLGKRLPADAESNLFRIVQEALTNCAKYARANTVSIEIANGDGKTRLTIADDGIGFAPASLGQPGSSPGLGLVTMRERAEFLGGRFSLESAPGQGTRITVQI